jgi:hypothetical protein
MKNKKTWRLVIGGLAATLMALVFMASCRGHHRGAQGRAEREVQALVDELELSPEQLQRVEQVKTLIHEHHRQAGEEREAHFQRIRQAIAQGNVDASEVQQEMDEKIDEMRQLAHSVTDELVPLVNSLNDEQRELLLAKLDRLHSRMERFHRRHHQE